MLALRMHVEADNKVHGNILIHKVCHRNVLEYSVAEKLLGRFQRDKLCMNQSMKSYSWIPSTVAYGTTDTIYRFSRCILSVNIL